MKISDETILEAALNLIARKGYRGATTREIAAAAGISEVTLFRRFGSKHKVLLAAVAREADRFKADEIRYSGDLETDLLKIVTFYHQLMTHRADVLAMLISEVPRVPELVDVMHIPQLLIGRIRLIIEQYQAQEQLIKEPPLEALAALIGPLFLTGIIGYLQPGLFDVIFEPQILVKQFLTGRQPHR